MSTYALNYRDGKWYLAAVVERKKWGVVEVEYLEGPEHEARDLVLIESVREGVDERPSD